MILLWKLPARKPDKLRKRSTRLQQVGALILQGCGGSPAGFPNETTMAN